MCKGYTYMMHFAQERKSSIHVMSLKHNRYVASHEIIISYFAFVAIKYRILSVSKKDKEIREYTH